MSTEVFSPAPLTWESAPKQGLVLIMGQRGQGKSALGWWLADKVAKETGKNVVAFGMPQAAQPAIQRARKGTTEYVDSMQEINTLKPSVIVVDEASFVVNARQSQSNSNQDWLKLAAICRHKDHLLIFISQHSRQLDIQLVMDCEMVLIKKPSALHVRAAKPEMKPELNTALQGFSARPVADSPKEWVFAVNYLDCTTRWLNSAMPAWWTEEISKSFQTVEI